MKKAPPKRCLIPILSHSNNMEIYNIAFSGYRRASCYFKSGGKGVAIGKVSETDSCFEIASSWSIKKKGSVESDFVISQGTSGIWTYRKWKSGIAECWCRKTITTNVTNVWGGLYSSGRLDALDISFPFEFKSKYHWCLER